MPPTNNAAMIALAKVLVDRNPSDLKLGYFTVLTIIADRNTSTAAGTNFQGPKLRSCSFRLMMSNVNDATNPAAEGMGKPRNSLPPPPPLIVARQLNRASRNAPHKRYADAMNHPNSG